MSEAPTLLVEDLSVTLATAHGPLQAVRGINLSVSRGETLCIVGESGSGKSMTALALMDLLPAAASRRVRRLSLLGEELRNAPEARLEALRGDRMAMIFQDPTTSLNPSYAIGEQLVEGLLRHRPGLTRAEALDRAAALLATCGIGEPRLRLRQYPHQLSGGLRQRVMIAMALITEPALLIADEPTTALDVTVQVQILELLEQLQRDFALAIILITHDLTVAGRIGSRAAVMYAGEIVESAPMPALLARPSHPYTRALLACAPSIKDGSRRELGFLPGQPPSLLGTLAGCQFRARCSLARGECAGIIPDRQTRSGDSYRCVIPAEEMPAFDAGGSRSRKAVADGKAQPCRLAARYRGDVFRPAGLVRSKETAPRPARRQHRCRAGRGSRRGRRERQRQIDTRQGHARARAAAARAGAHPRRRCADLWPA